MSGPVPGKALLVLLVGLATIACGCARPDWIESTLVTVDVSGTWTGSWQGSYPQSVTLTLQQNLPTFPARWVLEGARSRRARVPQVMCGVISTSLARHGSASPSRSRCCYGRIRS